MTNKDKQNRHDLASVVHDTVNVVNLTVNRDNKVTHDHASVLHHTVNVVNLTVNRDNKVTHDHASVLHQTANAVNIAAFNILLSTPYMREIHSHYLKYHQQIVENQTRLLLEIRIFTICFFFCILSI